MKYAVGLLLFLAMVPVAAQVAEPVSLLLIQGEKSFPVPINGQAVGFSLYKARQGLTVSARLANGGGHAYGDAFLMRRIGPGTTDADEIARVEFDLAYPFEGWVDLFAGVNLEAGEYWLVIAKPAAPAHSSINWVVAQPLSQEGTCLAGSYRSQSYTFQMDAAEYLPASKFETKFEPYRFQIEIREMRVPGEDPCKATIF